MSDLALTPPTLSVQFGEPADGWLPVRFEAGTFYLEFAASAIPANPLDALCEALAVVPAGGSAQVTWNLEPKEYRFSFEQEAGAVLFSILESAGRSRPRTCLLRLAGPAGEILQPFYEALQQLASRQFTSSQWPTLTKQRVERLGQQLRGQTPGAS